jgi:hypothetical protein
VHGCLFGARCAAGYSGVGGDQVCLESRVRAFVGCDQATGPCLVMGRVRIDVGLFFGQPQLQRFAEGLLQIGGAPFRRARLAIGGCVTRVELLVGVVTTQRLGVVQIFSIWLVVLVDVVGDGSNSSGTRLAPFGGPVLDATRVPGRGRWPNLWTVCFSVHRPYAGCEGPTGDRGPMQDECAEADSRPGRRIAQALAAVFAAVAVLLLTQASAHAQPVLAAATPSPTCTSAPALAIAPGQPAPAPSTPTVTDTASYSCGIGAIAISAGPSSSSATLADTGAGHRDALAISAGLVLSGALLLSLGRRPAAARHTA